MKNRLRLMAAQCTAIVLSLIMAFTIFPMAVSAETGDGDDSSSAAGAEAIPDFVSGQLIVVTEHRTDRRTDRYHFYFRKRVKGGFN